MIYTLILWIANCVGPTCAIPDYEIKHYDTLEECNKIVKIWNKVSEDNVGYCLIGKIEHKGHINFAPVTQLD